MPVKIKEQMKTGAPISLMQLIVGVISLMGVAVGIYVKIMVTLGQQDIRMTTIEHNQAQWQANAITLREARTATDKEQNDHIIKNAQDIELLKATKKDK